MRHLICPLLTALLITAACAQTAEFTVATWNVEHFVDEHDNPYVQRDQEFEKTPEQITAIAETIRAVDADIFAFQEIEGSDLLRAFAEEHLADMGYLHFVSAPDDNWHQNVALMSRFPLGPITSMTAVATPVPQFEEGESNLINDRLFIAEVHPAEDFRLLVVNVHLKAGGGENNAAWRRGQIELIRRWLDDQLRLDPELNICILGDFNCTPNSAEMHLLTEPAEGPAYLNVFSATTDRSGRGIDHILANNGFAAELVEDSPAVHDFTGEGQRPSDHRPVSARFVAADQ